MYSNITGAQLNAATGISAVSGANLTGTNLTGWNTSGKYLSSVNFTGSNITVAQLNASGAMNSANFTGLNLTGFAPTNKNILGANFSNVTGLTAAAIASASDIRTINLTGTGITKAQLEAALISVGKNPASAQYNTSSITF